LIDLGKESRLFPAWFPLLLLAVFLCLLVVIFPRNLVQTVSLSKPDQVSVAYLRVMLKRDPHNRQLRENLIAHYSQLGKTERALYELSALMLKEGDSELILWKIELLQFKFFKADAESPEKNKIGSEIFNLITTVLMDEQLDTVKLERLASVCQDLGWYDLVADIYRRLLELEKKGIEPQSVLWGIPSLLDFFISPSMAEEGSKAEFYALKSLDGIVATEGQSGEVGIKKLQELVRILPNSERLLRRIIVLSYQLGNVSVARDFGRRYLSKFSSISHTYQQQLKLELAANEAYNSLAWIRGQLGHLSNTVPLLNVAVRLALAADDPQQAKIWGRARLRLSPENEELRRDQVNLELGAGDVKGALRESLVLLQQQPSNHSLRRKIAQLAEWTGDFNRALTNGLWLAKKFPLGKDAEHSLLLAKQLASHEDVINLLLWKGEHKKLTVAELQELTLRYRLLNKMEQALKVLQKIRLRYPQQHAIYDQILLVYQYQDNLRDALSLLVSMETRFGVVLSDFIVRSELLLDLGYSDKAFQLLHRLVGQVTEDHDLFWHLYADVARREGINEEARKGYALLKKSHKIDKYESYHYLTLLRSQLSEKNLIRLAESLWREFDEASFLLIAMDVAHTHSLWDELEYLLSGSEAQYTALFDYAQYWAIKASLAQHQGDFLQAKKSLQKAMDLDPAFQKEFIWLLINSDDKNGLRSLLSELGTIALKRSDLWPVLAVAYLNLNRPKEALTWYQKYFYETTDRSVSEFLFYARVLQQAGYRVASDQVARYGLAQFTKKYSVLTEPLIDKIPYLLQRYAGREVAERGLQTSFFFGLKNAQFQTVAMDWYWFQGERFKARHWWQNQYFPLIKQPPFMRLATAVDNKNKESIEILVTEKTALTLTDKVAALQSIGADKKALNLALKTEGGRYGVLSENFLDQQIAGLLRRMPTGIAFMSKQKKMKKKYFFEKGVETVFSSGKNTYLVKLAQHSGDVAYSSLSSSRGFSETLWKVGAKTSLA